jgi:hypothetical protein
VGVNAGSALAIVRSGFRFVGLFVAFFSLRWNPSFSQIVARTPFINPTDSARPGSGSSGCSSYSNAATPLERKERHGNPCTGPRIWQVRSSSRRPTEIPLVMQCLYSRLSTLVRNGMAIMLQGRLDHGPTEKRLVARCLSVLLRLRFPFARKIQKQRLTPTRVLCRPQNRRSAPCLCDGLAIRPTTHFHPPGA